MTRTEEAAAAGQRDAEAFCRWRSWEELRDQLRATRDGVAGDDEWGTGDALDAYRGAYRDEIERAMRA